MRAMAIKAPMSVQDGRLMSRQESIHDHVWRLCHIAE
jgi:hypothetical protein